MTVYLNFKAASESPSFIRIPNSASFLLQLLAPLIMTKVYGRAHMPYVAVEATILPMVPALALPALNLATEDPVEEFFNFSVSEFMQLLRKCINMILSGRDFLKLRCLVLTCYLGNIKRIGGPK